MPLTKLREKGQITIPSSIRKSLHLIKNTVLSINKIGDAIIISQKPAIFDSIAEEFSSQAKKKGITLEDLLDDLKKIRKK